MFYLWNIKFRLMQNDEVVINSWFPAHSSSPDFISQPALISAIKSMYDNLLGENNYQIQLEATRIENEK